MRKIGERLFRYRYIIGAFLFIICVGLEIHGSSLNLWLDWLPGAEQNEEFIFGQLRAIRSDEWAVFTPLTLAQKENPFGAFSYFSTLARGSLTDCFILYGQPVWDPMMVFRIFQAGFLILTMGQGMACFWMGRAIVLFLVSIEMGMLLTEKNKWLSIAFAFMILFAPMIQWWYAICGLVEILIAGQLAVLIVDKYMRTRRYFVRLILVLALVWCGETYILTVYPAWMVTFGYAWLVLLITVIWKNKKNFYWRWKYDIWMLFFFLILLGGAMTYVAYKSGDCINAVLNSSYPGKRVSLGGQFSWMPLLSGSNLFFPYRTEMIPFLNAGVMPVCELALFMDFFPIGTLFAVLVMRKRKKADVCLLGLFAVDLLFTCYTMIAFPEWLAKLTLLSFSSSNRVAESLTFIRFLELFRAVGLYANQSVQHKRRRWTEDCIRISVGVSVMITVAVAMGMINQKILPDYLTNLDEILIIMIYFIVGWFVWNSNQKNAVKLFSLFCIGISLFAGGTVNPVQKGLNQVKENPLLVQIKSIDQTDPGIWITEGMQLPAINIPLLAGVSCINTTNVYPNLNQWTLFDPQGTQKEIYNRYAHIRIQLAEEPTSFVLDGTDQFTVNLNPDDLSKLDVTYCLSYRDLSVWNRPSCQFQLITEMGNYKIYKIINNPADAEVHVVSKNPVDWIK